MQNFVPALVEMAEGRFRRTEPVLSVWPSLSFRVIAWKRVGGSRLSSGVWCPDVWPDAPEPSP